MMTLKRRSRKKIILFIFYVCAAVPIIFVLMPYLKMTYLDGQQLSTIPKEKVRFYVNTTRCKMPYVNPFSPEIMKIYKPLPLQNCSTVDRIVRIIFNEKLQQYMLHIDEEVGRSLANFRGDIGCCYKQIVRNQGDDDRITILPCSKFYQDFVVPVHIDGIIVECYSADYTKLLQVDGFSFIQMKGQTNITGSTARKPSVLMIGIDSLSRINFRRTMVKTYNFMKRNGWHEMQGYNKMGDNTFPNLMAVLTGYDWDLAVDKCGYEWIIDSCPLIWKNFREYGYRTAYAEDEVRISTFNYLTHGFHNAPTDYYLRPYIMAFEDHLDKKKRCGQHNCLGMRHPAQYIYDFASQLATRYSDQPVFGLFWTNSFSHDCYDTTSAMDHVVQGYLQEFQEAGVFETSIVVFFSDHGRRWGKLTNLPDGFFEDRLPVLFVSLPKWFSQKYPQFVRALDLNQNRLTSPYDLHMTLKHLVELASDGEALLEPPEKCVQCQSLFRELPENRTCEEAGIPDHWCTCTPYEVIRIDKRMKTIAKLVIDKMNLYLRNRNFSGLCSELVSPSIETTFRKMVVDGKRDAKARSTYRLKLKVQPKKALFEATVVYYEQNKTVDVDVESISRLNSYASVSKCIDDKQAKKYCICSNAVGKEAIRVDIWSAALAAVIAFNL